MERTGKWRKEERGMVLDERRLWYYKKKKVPFPLVRVVLVSFVWT